MRGIQAKKHYCPEINCSPGHEQCIPLGFRPSTRSGCTRCFITMKISVVAKIRKKIFDEFLQKREKDIYQSRAILFFSLARRFFELDYSR